MTGQELAAKLRDLGFVQIKSHMTALSDFELLEIQARLEAYGIVGESAAKTSTVGGLKIKRKLRVPSGEEAHEESEPAAPAPAPAPVRAPEPRPEPEPVAPAALAEPEPPVSEDFEPETLQEAASPVPLESLPAREIEEEVQEPAEVLASEPDPAVVLAEAGATGELPPPPGEIEEGIVRPSTKRRSGKVVGFIDPAQFARAQPARPESRRLRSSDDVVPEVMPTMGRDRKAGVVRGDTTRGTMTAQELSDREPGRFLRRRRGQTGPTPAAGRRGAEARPEGRSSASPLSGGAVAIEAPVSIKKLANTLAVKENQVLQEAMKQVGFGININSVIDNDTAVLLAEEFGVQLEVKTEIAAETQLIEELAESRKAVGEAKLAKRAPCVAFLGHVDHGKTTLIDTIRKTHIADGEAGGITQHIGAYQVTTQHGHTLSIVDTPAQAACTAMRARGASAVDIVVLVVAADDGVMPQTEEALNHARAANTLVVVALNKIDKAG